MIIDSLFPWMLVLPPFDLLSQYQSDNEPRPPSCQEHHRQPLNMYCIQDRQLICGLCLTVGRHQGHPIDDLQAAFARERQTPSRLLAKLSESRWAQVVKRVNVAAVGKRRSLRTNPPRAVFRCASSGKSWTGRRPAARIC